jgi:hypothetical protein
MSQPNVSSAEGHESFVGTFRPLTWRGFACSVALPVLGVVLFYALALHVHFTLGRWPSFDEKLPALTLFCRKCLQDFAWILFFSLYSVPLLAVGSLRFHRWRHISVYAVAYAVFVALAAASVLLAPRPYMNWFFD